MDDLPGLLEQHVAGGDVMGHAQVPGAGPLVQLATVGACEPLAAVSAREQSRTSAF